MHCEWICSIVIFPHLWQKNSFALLQTLHFLFASNIPPHFLHESFRIVFVISFWYIILGKLTSLPVLWAVYPILSSSTIWYKHEHTNNSENQHLGYNDSRPIQKSRNIWPHLYGTWNHDGYWNRCLLGCRSINSSTSFLC